VGVSVGVPLVLAVAGGDYLIARNTIAGWLPFAVVVAAGLDAPTVRAAGPALAVVLCGLFLAALIAVEARPEFQRDDWRGVAKALGPPTGPRALIVSPLDGRVPLGLYEPGLCPYRRGVPARVRELDIVAVPQRRPGQTPHPPRTSAPHLRAFPSVTHVKRSTFTLFRLRASNPVRLFYAQLASLKLPAGLPDVLIQDAGSNRGGRCP
jgi:hypothetical protein